MQAHWKIILLGYGKEERGDVITNDGEFIGTWECEDDVIVSFTPDGATEPMFGGPFLGLVIGEITKWHESRS